MGAGSGRKAFWIRGLHSISHSQNLRSKEMKDKVILLIEDNRRDEALTLRALKTSNILNEVVVARDGVEALDYLFGTGKYDGRHTSVLPQVVLLDLKLPKMDGLQVLQALRADKRSKRLPVVIFT